MEIHAYDEDYLEYAQKNLGDMMDFAANTCGIDVDVFFKEFIRTGVASQFGNGNPKYVVGKTGCEIARDVLEKNNTLIDETIEDVMFIDKSPEYWAGWILAYYQWISGKSFKEIYRVMNIKQILKLYPTMHEADPERFISYFEKLSKEKCPKTKLKCARENVGLSQTELAKKAGVSVRQIQLFEQNQRDINKTQVQTLFKLAKALHCNMEDLVE